MRKRKIKKHPFSAPLIIAGSFFSLIVLGTILLKLPFATTTPISWVDSLFVATSATTVTGLSVFDPGTTLTLFGELVLLVLIQCGGNWFNDLCCCYTHIIREKNWFTKSNLFARVI